MKDPAFLFYTQDFLTGTMFFTDEEVGLYIRLFCAQHQLGGFVSKKAFNSKVPEDSVIRSKFIETEDGYFNERLMVEIEKRSRKSSNLSENAKQMWSKRKANVMQLHSKCITEASAGLMPIENEDEDEDEDKASKKRIPDLEDVKTYFSTKGYPAEEGESFFNHFAGQGWVTGSGMPITNWRLKAENWHKDQRNKPAAPTQETGKHITLKRY